MSRRLFEEERENADDLRDRRIDREHERATQHFPEPDGGGEESVTLCQCCAQPWPCAEGRRAIDAALLRFGAR